VNSLGLLFEKRIAPNGRIILKGGAEFIHGMGVDSVVLVLLSMFFIKSVL